MTAIIEKNGAAGIKYIVDAILAVERDDKREVSYALGEIKPSLHYLHWPIFLLRYKYLYKMTPVWMTSSKKLWHSSVATVNIAPFVIKHLAND